MSLDAAALEVVLTRHFDAPRDLVFRAWSDPAMLARWWGPMGFTNPRCDSDFRPGGALRIDMRGPGGEIYPMEGAYEEVVAPECIVFTAAALDAEGRPHFRVRNTISFAEEGGGTLLTVQARVLETYSEAAAGYLAGMRMGWTQSLERLDGCVKGA